MYVVITKKHDGMGSGCSFEGIDLNSRVNASVTYNDCEEGIFAIIKRRKHTYYYMYDQKLKKYDLYRDDELPANEKDGCGTIASDPIEYEHTIEFTGNARDLAVSRKFIRLYIVTDNLRRNMFSSNAAMMASTLNVASVVQNIYKSFNSLDYPIEVEIDGIVHLPETTTPYVWESSTNPSTILSLFYEYASFKGWRKPGRTVMLLSGYNMQGSTIGIAYMSSACTSGGVAVSSTLTNDYATGKTTAHELGHTLGIRHINSYVAGSSLSTAASVMDCSKQSYSVMSPYILGSTYIWDSCSIEWFKLFNEGFPYGCVSGTCSYVRSATTACFMPSTTRCGNTIVDRGEECDCGTSEECTDPCCDAKTCKLKGACSPLIHDCCTDTCEIANKNKVCRPSSHIICDKAEYCDGVSRTCPTDLTNNFVDCTEDDWYKKTKIKGKCYGGKCRSHDIQCLNVNPAYGLGLIGSCSRGVNGDPACKKLYCQPSGNSFCTIVYAPQLLYVAEGTPCGDQMICRNQTCISLVPTSKPTSSRSPTQPTKPTKIPSRKPSSQSPSRLTRGPTKYPTTSHPSKRPSTFKPTLFKIPTFKPLPSTFSPAKTRRPTNRPWFCSPAFSKLYPNVNCNRNQNKS